MTILPHTHETGECLACDLELLFSSLGPFQVQDDALKRISTALATSQARVAELTERHAHQCRLNVTLVEQNALLIQRNTELEADREHFELLMLNSEKMLKEAQSAALNAGFSELRTAWKDLQASLIWIKAERARKAKG